MLHSSIIFNPQNTEMVYKFINSIDLDSIPWGRITVAGLFCVFMFLINHTVQQTFRTGFLHAIKHYKAIAVGMGIEDTIPVLFWFDKMITYFSIFLAIIGTSKLLDLNNKELLYIFGIIGIIISVLTQQVISNLASGIIMLMENNIRIGDTIEINNLIDNPKTTLGVVSAIKSRCTIVTTPDGQELIIPNTTLINGVVVNLTLHKPFRRIHVPFYIDNKYSYLSLKSKILAIIKNNPVCLQIPAPPDIWITMVDAVGVRCELVVWINQRKISTPPKAALYESILTAVSQHQPPTPTSNTDYDQQRFAIAIPASENIMYSE